MPTPQAERMSFVTCLRMFANAIERGDDKETLQYIFGPPTKNPRISAFYMEGIEILDRTEKHPGENC